jgi:hypothetical protein
MCDKAEYFEVQILSELNSYKFYQDLVQHQIFYQRIRIVRSSLRFWVIMTVIIRNALRGMRGRKV